jgi:hypothetical protein
MFIEVEGYNGAKLLLAVDKIVSVTTYTSTENDLPKTFTAIRTVIDQDVDDGGVQEYYQSNESYESIKAKIEYWFKPTYTITPDPK